MSAGVDRRIRHESGARAPTDRRRARRLRAMAAGAALVWAAVGGCGSDRAVLELEGGGDSRRGPELVEAYGCGSCHRVPGVRGADGRVGPSLEGFGEQIYIAGELVNTPDNLTRWITDPQAVEPGTAMPDLDVREEDARDLAAYLLSLGR